MKIIMLQRPRGTKDIYGNDIKIYNHIFNCFENLARSYRLEKIITPTFEHYEVFDKTAGETSDIISKEVYSFKDLGGRQLALKPEGTASIARAIVENKLFQDKKYNKLYYIDSMYRYDKPQKGRLRQFYQIGVEFTNELNQFMILDAIVLAWTFLKQLNISEFKLCINSLGTDEERKKYIDALKQYFLKHKELLSETSQSRIETNPLRILDDKVDSQLEVVKNCPKIVEFWSQETQEEFNQIQNKLKALNIEYEIDYSLVRGLDYYSKIIFEFISNSPALGTQSTLIGGGCYQNLLKNNSEYLIDGVGFGCGVERIFEILKANEQDNQTEQNDVYFIVENEQQYQQILEIIYELRANGLMVEYNQKIRKFSKVFADAKKINTKVFVLQELDQQQSKMWTIKNDQTKIVVSIDELKDKIIENVK